MRPAVPFFPAAILAAAFAPGIPAASAAPWTPPSTVGPAAMELYRAVSGVSGAALAAGYGSQTTLAPVAADGSPGPTREGRTVVDLAAYADRAVFLRRSSNLRRVGVSFGDLGARRLGRERVLHRGTAADAALAVGPGGQTLVALSVDGDDEDGDELDNARVRLTWSVDRGHRRWRSQALPGRTDVLDMAVDAHGTAILLLQRGRIDGAPVTARTLDLRRGRLGKERTLDRPRVDWLWGSIATDGAGRAVLTWGAQDGGEEADRRMVVKAAFRRRGTDRFGATQTLDRGGAVDRTSGGPYAAMDAAGNATVAWSQTVAARGTNETYSVPRAATAVTDGRLGCFRTLLTDGAVSDAVAAGGTTLVAATGSAQPSEGAAGAAGVSGVFVRERGSGFAPLEPVTGDDPRDAEPLDLTAGPGGFRAFWVPGGDDDRLRSAFRPTG